MEKLNIFVAVHKECEVYSNSTYQPIWAGKALSTESLPWTGDDSGLNISKKNRMYSEMSVHYWIWKNISSEYVGLCHYRRYFSTVFTEKNIEEEMTDCDIILPCAIYHNSPLKEKLYTSMCPEDREIFLMVIKQHFPDYYPAAIKYLFNNRKDYAFNMMVCKKELYDKMMNFVFDVLFDCERYVKVSSYTTSHRIFGYYAEYLVPIYCFAHNLKIKEMELVEMLGNDYSKVILKRVSMCDRIVSKIKCAIRYSKRACYYYPAVYLYTGMMQDGIIDKYGKLL